MLRVSESEPLRHLLWVERCHPTYSRSTKGGRGYGAGTLGCRCQPTSQGQRIRHLRQIREHERARMGGPQGFSRCGGSDRSPSHRQRAIGYPWISPATELLHLLATWSVVRARETPRIALQRPVIFIEYPHRTHPVRENAYLCWNTFGAS
eukprot:COSAG01_NODE_7027_length_3384_cov_4.728158_2_plen_150_part_00